MKHVLISDPTLRDGSHAVQHQISKLQIMAYCCAADAAGIPIVEVGHGNGLAASSLQLGFSLLSDAEMLEIARENLRASHLGVFIIPGFGTIKRDLMPAIELGIDVVRVGSHCTEADTTARHLSYAREKGKKAFGNLMMSHMADTKTLLAESRKMQSYGAEGVVLMDSAGALLPSDVKKHFEVLSQELEIPVGLHAHNNLGLAVANSIAAVEAGGTILDGTARGFGAGAGNTQLEVLVPVLAKMGYETNIDLYKVLDLSDLAEKQVMKAAPVVRSGSIVSGLAGVVSTFSNHVSRISAQYGVDPRDVLFELGKRKVVAGQEDMIIEAAMILAQSRKQLV